jgi:thiol-disulfide isomerase/thioredoxin
MLTPAFLSDKFTKALPYDRYVGAGTPDQQRRWARAHEAARLTPAQAQLVAGFVREMKLLVVSGLWCGDCVEQCPLLARIAEANARIDLRFLDRDEHKDLSGQLRINGGDRVPVALFLAEDFEPCAVYGDRPLSRYRALAGRQLGPACPTGLFLPPPEEMAATLQDWLDEVERVQWLLRLSARLRQKHGD